MKALNRSQIAKRYGVTYSAVHLWTNENTFPQPVSTLGRNNSKMWNPNAVNAWVTIYRPHSKLVIGKPVSAPAVSSPQPTKQEKPIIPAGKSMLDVITFLLENDREKQKLVLELLLD